MAVICRQARFSEGMRSRPIGGSFWPHVADSQFPPIPFVRVWETLDEIPIDGCITEFIRKVQGESSAERIKLGYALISSTRRGMFAFDGVRVGRCQAAAGEPVSFFLRSLAGLRIFQDAGGTRLSEQAPRARAMRRVPRVEQCAVENGAAGAWRGELERRGITREL